jgi:hypothetical protein
MVQKVKGKTVIYVQVKPEFEKRFTFWAKALGLTKSQLGSLTLQSGLTRFVQTIRGDEALDHEDEVLVTGVEIIQGNSK